MGGKGEEESVDESDKWPEVETEGSATEDEVETVGEGEGGWPGADSDVMGIGGKRRGRGTRGSSSR